MPGYAYLRDPAAIYAESFAAIRRELDLAVLPASLRGLAVRLAHAVGDTSIVADLCWSDGAAEAGRAALAKGAPILVDANMVAHGIIRSRLPAGNEVICRLDDAGLGARVAVDLWVSRLAGAIVAIGNAPTALFRLLELLDAGAARPAVILGFPVGFVGAAEAKEALIASRLGIPHVALRGRRGGSALAAAAVNALAGAADEGLLGDAS
jgi:precorrin-8X/cobalt-precorrin-8 methylmutase